MNTDIGLAYIGSNLELSVLLVYALDRANRRVMRIIFQDLILERDAISRSRLPFEICKIISRYNPEDCRKNLWLSMYYPV